ncbi:MAG: hypothetical protein Q7J67_04350 [bacterium]|nr:hypothetical protein [bacterium]
MVIDIDSSKQLFLDDLLIENTYKIGRLVHQPKKDSKNPLIKKGDRESPHFYGTVLFDNGRFRMWYSTFWGNGDCGGIAYAESEDGIFWEKPSLGLVEIKGNRNNNLIFFETAPQAVFQPNVIKLSDGNKETGQYQMLYWDRPSLDKRTHGVSVAFSNDGIHWKKYEKNPVWSTPLDRSMHQGEGGADDVICVSYDRLTGKYRAFRRVLPNESPVYMGPEDDYFKAGDYLRVIATAESEDSINWKNFKVILSPDLGDRADTQFYGMGGFNYFGTYIGMLWMYHTNPQDGTIDVQLATSRDGTDWKRVGNREIFLSLGRHGDFDERMIFTGNEPLIVGDEIWIYYSGHSNKHNEPKREQTLSGIGLARLRLDGFVSLEGQRNIGSIKTKVLKFKGNKLLINGRTKPDGFIGVEILDENENSMKGKNLEDCDKFIGDSVKKTISWRGKERLENLQGRPIKLRFYIKKGEIYSFQFTD